MATMRRRVFWTCRLLYYIIFRRKTVTTQDRPGDKYCSLGVYHK